MFRPLRRHKQSLDDATNRRILREGSHGVLACLGDDDYPYAVPLSYVALEDVIYFHSAKVGHKVDALIKQPKVSFCVIDQDDIVSQEFTSYFRSVIAFGQARIVSDAERERALRALMDKYSADAPPEAKERELHSSDPIIVAIDIEHLSGKEAIELVRARGETQATQ